MKAIVLAGGLGTRLKARVPDVPKAMAPIGKRPFLGYVLDRLLDGGIREIVLALGYGASLIERHFGAYYRNATLSYCVETEPLGTGGAAVHAFAAAGSAPAIVQNGDTLLDMDVGRFVSWYAERRCDLALVVARVPDASRYGRVRVEDGRVVGFEEKPAPGEGWINAGVYAIDPRVFPRFGLAGTFSLERDLLERHCRALAPQAFPVEGFFIDIGVPEDYERALRELSAFGPQAADVPARRSS